MTRLVADAHYQKMIKFFLQKIWPLKCFLIGESLKCKYTVKRVSKNGIMELDVSHVLVFSQIGKPILSAES